MLRRILLVTPFLLLPLVAPFSAADGACQSVGTPGLPSTGLVALDGGASACALADAASPTGQAGAQANACAVTSLPTDDVRHLCLDGSGAGGVSTADGGILVGPTQKVDWDYADGFTTGGTTSCKGCVTPPISIHIQSMFAFPEVQVFNAGAYSCVVANPPLTTYDALVTCTAKGAPPTGHWECVDTSLSAHPYNPVSVVSGMLGCGKTEITATGYGNRLNPNGTNGAADQGDASVITCGARDDQINTLSDWEVWCAY